MRSTLTFLFAAIIALSIGATSAHAQMDMSSHTGMQMKEVPAPETLPAPLRLSGIGNSHITIKATPEAQLWFDQGLNLLHDFWDYESARAFQQAVRVDPNCAMCYAGLYQALMFRRSQPSAYTDQALANAVRLQSLAGDYDRLYIDAVIASDNAAKAGEAASPTDQKSAAAWRELVKKYPDDPQAKIFLSGSLRDGFDDAGEPKKGTKESIAVLEDVLKSAPNDSAANHYWIHAMEPGNHPEKALASAALLASLAPTSGHMVHMPGHIFYRVGDYAQAERWFTVSTIADEKYMRTQKVSVDDNWNYVHNLMYSIANLMEEGKLAQATALSGKLTGARGQFAETLYIQSPRDGISRIDSRLPVALRTGDWPLVLTLIKDSKPDTRLQNLTFLAGQLQQFASGMQAAQTGNLAAAQAASNTLDAELWHMSQKVKDAPKPPKDDLKAVPTAPVMPDAMPAPLLSSLSIMSLELRATILALQKQLPEAKALFAQAAHEEKALGYREPPTYIRPVGETEGLALLAAGDPAGAHQAYAAALTERPNSGFGLYGMARSSEAAGAYAQATAEYARFSDAWKNADPTAPELTHAKAFLASQTKTTIVASAR
jgi:hypothetical protein